MISKRPMYSHKLKGSSRKWLLRHLKDPFVKQAQLQSYRSRAAFKLKQLHQRTPIFKTGSYVLDLGSAPGGWSQVAQEYCGPTGKILAVDILPMDPLSGVYFIQGSYDDATVRNRIHDFFSSRKPTIVLSDVCPSLSGNRSLDAIRSKSMAENILHTIQTILAPGGVYVAKIFQAGCHPHFVHNLKGCFDKVIFSKPAASRATSSEIYCLGLGFRPHIDG